MDWSWQRIPAEYVVADVRLCRKGKLGKRKGFLHVRKGRIEALGVGAPTTEGLPVLKAGGPVCAPGVGALHVPFRGPGAGAEDIAAAGRRGAGG